MKFLISAILFCSFTAQAADLVRYKNFAQVKSLGAYYVTCSGKAEDGPQVHASFNYGWSVSGGLGIQWSTFAMVAPSEALLTREYSNQGFQLQWLEANQLKISGGQSTYHNDILAVEIKDATNGKFKGQLHFVDRATNLTVDSKVVCGITDSGFPR